MSKKIIVALAFFAVVVLSANGVVWGQTPNPGPVARFGNVGGIIDVKSFSGVITPIAYHDVGGLKGSEYFPNLPLWPAGTWPANHITRENNMISHIAGSTLVSDTYNLVVGMGPVTGSVSDAANRLWDNAYGLWRYTKVDPSASIDPSMNCHGYSTGLNTWTCLAPSVINVVGGIICEGDDYAPKTGPNDLKDGAILATLGDVYPLVEINGNYVSAFLEPIPTHSARIGGVKMPVTQPNGDIHIKATVYEKCRESAVYEKEITIKWEHKGGGVYKMEKIALSWGVFDRFYVRKP